MPKGREELRRGIRNLIEHASREMDAIAEEEAPPASAAPADSRPILRLVRSSPETAAHTSDVNVLPQNDAAASSLPAEDLAPASQPVMSPGPGPLPLSDFTPAPFESPALLPKKGVCGAYFVSRRCWEVPEAYCNTALQVCMMRECPVYHLNKDEMERRFAGKFSHFWGGGSKTERT